MISKITNTMPIVENPLCVNESPSFTWVIIYQDGSTYQCRSLPGRFTWPQICSFTNHYFGHWHDFFNTFVFCDWNWSKNVSHWAPPPWQTKFAICLNGVTISQFKASLNHGVVLPFHDMKNKIKCKHENIKISK